MGIANPYNLALIVEQAGVPVILDAGYRHRLGRRAGDGGGLRGGARRERDLPLRPIRPGWPRRSAHAVHAGRLAGEAGRIPRRRYAEPSSPTDGLYVDAS